MLLRFCQSALATCLLIVFTSAACGEIMVKSGEKIAFLGDSLTHKGWTKPHGYVRLVLAGLKANGVDVEAVPAGYAGDKSNQMLARLQKDVLEKRPHWMTLSCGINDLWEIPLDDAQAATRTYPAHPEEPPKSTFAKNVTVMVDQAQAAGIKPLILTATVFQEDLKNLENARLAPYNHFLRKLAAERQLPLADLNALFAERITAENKPGQRVLTVDGVHMNPEGNKLMAIGVLKAFGLDDAQLKRAEEAWAAIPAGAN